MSISRSRSSFSLSAFLSGSKAGFSGSRIVFSSVVVVLVDFGVDGILESVVDMLDDELREEFMRGGLLLRLFLELSLECLFLLLLFRCFGVSLL